MEMAILLFGTMILSRIGHMSLLCVSVLSITPLKNLFLIITETNIWE